MTIPTTALRRLMLPTLVLAAAACTRDRTRTIVGPDPNRTYAQVERLGNPLTSEVFFEKRDHGLHNTTPPDSDEVRGFKTKIAGFAAAFGQSATVQNTLATVLVPDVLVTYPNRDGATAGWLTWALQPNVGYGGRKLTDDVVDAGLSAVFGTLLDPANPVRAGLTSDNVPPSVRSFSTAFPYLEPARP